MFSRLVEGDGLEVAGVVAGLGFFQVDDGGLELAGLHGLFGVVDRCGLGSRDEKYCADGCESGGVFHHGHVFFPLV